MLKRIAESFTTSTVDELNEAGLVVPTFDERENPGIPWADVIK